MGSLHAIALLELAASDLPAGVRSRALDDGALVYMEEDFAAEPSELALALRRMLGDLLDEHEDARGILVLPDVADPKARTYAGVVEEIGEGGAWIPKAAGAEIPERFRNALPGSFDATLGAMMSAIDPGTIAEMQRALLSGDGDAIRKATAHIERVVEKTGHAEAVRDALESHDPDQQDDAALATLQEMVKDLPIDLSAPGMRDAIAKVAGELEKNPDMLRALSEQLFGALSEDEEEDEDDDGEEPS